MTPREAAARRAMDYVREGMTLGLGTGRTASHFVATLGERWSRDPFPLRCVATSRQTYELASRWRIPLADLNEVDRIDLTVDGADEVDPALNLIKGGGGALVREKLVAAASQELIIVCDASKLRPALGAFPLPIAILPFGWRTTLRRLQTFCQHVTLRLSNGPDTSPYTTDDGLYIADMHLQVIRDPGALERSLKCITGVAEVGLFVGMTSRVLVGHDDGHVEEKTRLQTVLQPGGGNAT